MVPRNQQTCSDHFVVRPPLSFAEIEARRQFRNGRLMYDVTREAERFKGIVAFR